MQVIDGKYRGSYEGQFCVISGEKKKLRQERIAIKRRERMIKRGVDLEKINFVSSK